MKVCCIQLIALSCMVIFQNYLAKHCVTYKDHVSRLKVNPQFRLTCMLLTGHDENLFVSYSYPRFDCKVNVSLFDQHGSSLVSSILYKSAFMDL